MTQGIRRPWRRRAIATGVLALVALGGWRTVSAAQQPAEDVRVNADAKALAAFQENVKRYVALHKKLESSLQSLPKEATPEQIDKHQRELANLIQRARARAKAGDVFSRESRAVIRRLLLRIFKGPEGRKLKDSIMDENPGPIAITVNGRYPDTIPLSTVPPQVLETLPKLPDELEYRFIGEKLILLDVHAHIIADYIVGALPK